MIKVIPHAATQTSAKLWIGALSPPTAAKPQAVVTVDGVVVELGEWKELSFRGSRLDYQWVESPPLTPDAPHTVRAMAPGHGTADARFETLPLTLGTEAAPLRVLVGSCYYTGNKRSKLASTLVEQFARFGLTPRLRIWAGDQVYLDAPWHHYMFHRHDPAELEARHSDAYARTFFAEEGLGKVISQGANVFCPDDHELWNNAPDPSIVAKDSDTPAGRTMWREIGLALLGAFQGDTLTPVTFDVPPLSFFVLDARVARLPDRADLITDAQRAALSGWLGGLQGPGVLVIGQPIFDFRTKRVDNKADYHLADYAEYTELMRMLATASHSIVVITGDVHFSRVAQVHLPTGRSITEFISSPLALVAGTFGLGGWKEAPQRLDIDGPDPFGSSEITTDTTLQVDDESMMLLEFYKRGMRIFCQSSVWRIKDLERGQSCYRNEFEVGR